MSNASNVHAQENRQIYEYCRDNGHMGFLDKAAKCDRYVQGDQWDPRTRALLKKRKKPVLTINRTMATFAALAGEQLARGGDVSFRASASGSEETAQALDKLWINFSTTKNFGWLKTRAFWDGVIRSRGYIDLRMNFDDNMQGNVDATYLNSKDVMLYPEDSGYDPDEWTGVLVTKWLAARDIAELYDVDPKEIWIYADTDAMGFDYADWAFDSFGDPFMTPEPYQEDLRSKYRRLRVIERQEWEYKRVEAFVDPQTGSVNEIPDAWDREKIQMTQAARGYHIVNRRMRKIRWVASVGNLTLHNAISPYRHFTPVPYFPMMIGGVPLGIVEHLVSPQDMVNKTLSQELHIVAGIANSGYIVSTNKLINMTPAQLREQGGQDGVVIEVQGSIKDAIERLKPNLVPTGLDRLSYKAEEAMHDVSLVSESMQGMNRPDESGTAAEHKSARNVISLGPIYASLDETNRIVARNWLDLVQGFVTEERLIRVTRKSDTAKTEEVTVNQEQPDGSILNDLTVGEYGVHIVDVPSRQTADEAQYKQLMSMQKQGAPIPWSFTVDASSVYNKGEIVDYLKGVEGRSEPSEQDKKTKELETALLKAEVEDKQASASVKQAQAQKSLVEARNEAGGDDGAQAEMAKVVGEGELNKAKATMEGELNQMKAGAEARRKNLETATRTETETEMAELKMQALRQQMVNDQRKADQELEMMRAQLLIERDKAAQAAELERKKADVAMETQRTTAAAAAKAPQNSKTGSS